MAASGRYFKFKIFKFKDFFDWLRETRYQIVFIGLSPPSGGLSPVQESSRRRRRSVLWRPPALVYDCPR